MVVNICNEEDTKLSSIKKMCQRRDAYFQHIIEAVAPVVKSWYLKTSLAFLKDRQLNEGEEELFADFTEYCTGELDKVSKHAIRLKSHDFFEEH